LYFFAKRNGTFASFMVVRLLHLSRYFATGDIRQSLRMEKTSPGLCPIKGTTV